MPPIIFLRFRTNDSAGTLIANRRTSVRTFYDDPDPEDEANYIDRHRHVDTNYVSSGGWDRMK